MALTAAQRRKLPASAFVYHAGSRSNWRYPVPTKAQAKRAGISERQRLRIHRAAKSYAARRSTRGTPSRVNAVVRRRGPVKGSRGRGAARRRVRVRSGPARRRRRTAAVAPSARTGTRG